MKRGLFKVPVTALVIVMFREYCKPNLRETNISIWITIAALLVTAPANAYEINEKFSIGGILAGVYQYQDPDEPEGGKDAGRGAFAIQPELSYRPTQKDEIFIKFGFAVANGLNEISPFSLVPWAADLKDDVKDINGRDRDYLLTAWYKHTFHFNETHKLGITGGLIDSTDYLDENIYSNDEFTQFMNEALVNAPNHPLPAYDAGVALEWEAGRFTLKGVLMDVGSNDGGNAFQFYGLQIGYRLNTALGEGDYRLIGLATSDGFFDPQGVEKESVKALALSLDQALGEVFGVWLRIVQQDDERAIEFKALYSGGLNISGKPWGRPDDNLGIGYAFLDGGNLDFENTQVAEAYIRFLLHTYFALTLDVQYMREEFVNGDTSKGFIYGLRLVLEF